MRTIPNSKTTAIALAISLVWAAGCGKKAEESAAKAKDKPADKAAAGDQKAADKKEAAADKAKAAPPPAAVTAAGAPATTGKLVGVDIEWSKAVPEATVAVTKVTGLMRKPSGRPDVWVHLQPGHRVLVFRGAGPKIKTAKGPIETGPAAFAGRRGWIDRTAIGEPIAKPADVAKLWKQLVTESKAEKIPASCKAGLFVGDLAPATGEELLVQVGGAERCDGLIGLFTAGDAPKLLGWSQRASFVEITPRLFAGGKGFVEVFFDSTTNPKQSQMTRQLLAAPKSPGPLHAALDELDNRIDATKLPATYIVGRFAFPSDGNGGFLVQMRRTTRKMVGGKEVDTAKEVVMSLQGDTFKPTARPEGLKELPSPLLRHRRGWMR